MGVYIKDMEMPKNCDECNFLLDCPHDQHQDGYKMIGSRPNSCPLVEVPEQMKWIPVAKRLPECDLGAEVGNIEWISCGMVHAGCFGRGGKYRDAYFRTWTDAGEGMDAKDADYWRAVTLPEPPESEE